MAQDRPAVQQAWGAPDPAMPTAVRQAWGPPDPATPTTEPPGLGIPGEWLTSTAQVRARQCWRSGEAQSWGTWALQAALSVVSADSGQAGGLLGPQGLSVQHLRTAPDTAVRTGTADRQACGGCEGEGPAYVQEARTSCRTGSHDPESWRSTGYSACALE